MKWAYKEENTFEKRRAEGEKIRRKCALFTNYDYVYFEKRTKTEQTLIAFTSIIRMNKLANFLLMQTLENFRSRSYSRHCREGAQIAASRS